MVFGCGNDDDHSESASIEKCVISDSTGDWGYPSPCLRYSRGPGYTIMSFIFDTLVWNDENGFILALAEEWECEEYLRR